MRKLVLDQTGKVVNAILVRDPAEYTLPVGHSFAARDDGDIGWTLNPDNTWTKVEPVRPTPKQETVADKLAKIGLTVAELKAELAR